MKVIEWKNDTHIIAGTTLRDPKVKEYNNVALHVGGTMSDVIKNRTALAEQLGISLSDMTFAMQTHSDHIHEVTTKDKGKGSQIYEDGIPDCDALYTKEKGIALGVFHADCVPVLLYDPITGIIAAIHSGWQGTVKEITRKTVETLITKEHVQPEDIIAYIGPSIAYQSFEVGKDVLEKIETMSFDTSPYITYRNNDKAFVDNRGLNRQMLCNLGVLENNITVDKNDTFQHNDAFFSYRREHDCGRHMSYILRIK